MMKKLRLCFSVALIFSFDMEMSLLVVFEEIVDGSVITIVFYNVIVFTYGNFTCKNCCCFFDTADSL